MTKLGQDLIQSAKEARAIARGEADPSTYRVYEPGDVDVRGIREHLAMSQIGFAERFGFAVTAVRDWEYGRRKPDRAARVLLMVVKHRPEAVDDALQRSAQEARAEA